MNSEIVPAPRPSTPAIAEAPGVSAADLYAALLADAKKETTRIARVRDVADLARFLGLADPELATAALVAGGPGHGNALALGYRQGMQGRGLAAATINRRLKTCRRAVFLARRLGLIAWALDVDAMPDAPYRDTTGPGHDGWLRLKDAARGDRPKARRDRAMLLLLHDAALRRGELLALDVEDLDLSRARVQVMGKGRSAKEWLTLNDSTVKALSEWLDARGRHDGPLFVSFHRRHKAGAGAGRLTGDGLADVVKALSRKAGLGRHARPHGLRHQGITRALDVMQGDMRKVQKFARHADPKTTQHYDDARRDFFGEVTRALDQGS